MVEPLCGAVRESIGGWQRVSIVRRLDQEKVVWLIALLCFVTFSFELKNFFASGNLIALARSVAVLGMLASAMAITVIGRGIDLSLAAIGAVSAAWSVKLMSAGVSEPLALAVGLAAALVIGVANGFLIAFVEIPAIFATLAMGILIFGISEFMLIGGTIVNLPRGAVFTRFLGQAQFFGIPFPIIASLFVTACVSLLLRYTRWGRFTYAQGDNYETARLTGIKVRSLTVGHYVLAAFVAFIAGLTLAGSGPTFSTKIADSGLIFDIVLVVVLGGVSLGGGSGTLGGVLAATVLLGALLNGMTIMDMQRQIQDLIKGIVLLSAIVLDGLLHPRDEETTRQSDI
jgi:ribose transport system permease protein